MRDWDAARIAEAAHATLLQPPPPDTQSTGPERVTIDSRDSGPGSLFVGLSGANADGGAFVAQAIEAGAWGVLSAPEHAQALGSEVRAAVLSTPEPLAALQRLATAWRRELGADVIGVTGSTGKTTTKDMLRTMLSPHRRTVASRANFNTEIGLPLEILAAPRGTEVLVLEMAMRGAGQIAELAEIAEPDVGVIVSIGPVHLELLGSLEAIAAAKAELIAGLKPGGTAVVPAGEPLLAPHLRADLRTFTFGPGGDVDYRDGEIIDRGELVELEIPFVQAHLRRNVLAAVAAARAVGATPGGVLDWHPQAGRGARTVLPDGITLIDDCYNANPMSMLAALQDLAAGADGEPGEEHGRRVAVLGDMLELGPDELRFHVEMGIRARELGIDLLVTVGPLAAAMADPFEGEAYPVADAGEAAALLGELLAPGDVVLVKASRGVGLELVCQALAAGAAA